MGVLQRIVRMLRADVHGMVDRMEDKALLLKQCLREMEAALGLKEAELKKLSEEREQLQRGFERTVHETEKLEADLSLAVDRDKDDIARGLIRRLMPLREQCSRLGGQIDVLDTEMQELRGVIRQQQEELSDLRLQSTTLLRFSGHAARHMDSSPEGSGRSPATDGPAPEEVEIELLRLKEKRTAVAQFQGDRS